MTPSVEDLDDQTKYRQIIAIPYSELMTFVLDYIKRKSTIIVFFWSVCLFFLVVALNIRINISGYFPERNIFTNVSNYGPDINIRTLACCFRIQTVILLYLLY